jgi:hypothetical protein
MIETDPPAPPSLAPADNRIPPTLPSLLAPVVMLTLPLPVCSDDDAAPVLKRIAPLELLSSVTIVTLPVVPLRTTFPPEPLPEASPLTRCTEPPFDSDPPAEISISPAEVSPPLVDAVFIEILPLLLDSSAPGMIEPVEISILPVV